VANSDVPLKAEDVHWIVSISTSAAAIGAGRVSCFYEPSLKYFRIV